MKSHLKTVRTMRLSAKLGSCLIRLRGSPSCLAGLVGALDQSFCGARTDRVGPSPALSVRAELGPKRVVGPLLPLLGCPAPVAYV